MNDAALYREMFDYLRGDTPPTLREPTVVFGRNDEKVALAAGSLITKNLVEGMVITGGFGKDSGNLAELGYTSEADFLHRKLQGDAITHNYTLPRVLLDENATNGGENSRNSLHLLNEYGYDTHTLNAVAHATSARRLAEMLKSEAVGINGSPSLVRVKPTDYTFDTSNPLDRTEARSELLRLADWPAKGWLLPQENLPVDLVDFAKSEQDKR